MPSSCRSVVVGRALLGGHVVGVEADVVRARRGTAPPPARAGSAGCPAPTARRRTGRRARGGARRCGSTRPARPACAGCRCCSRRRRRARTRPARSSWPCRRRRRGSSARFRCSSSTIGCDSSMPVTATPRSRQRDRDPAGADRELEGGAVPGQLGQEVDRRVEHLRREHERRALVVRRRGLGVPVVAARHGRHAAAPGRCWPPIPPLPRGGRSVGCRVHDARARLLRRRRPRPTSTPPASSRRSGRRRVGAGGRRGRDRPHRAGRRRPRRRGVRRLRPRPRGGPAPARRLVRGRADLRQGQRRRRRHADPARRRRVHAPGRRRPTATSPGCTSPPG